MREPLEPHQSQELISPQQITKNSSIFLILSILPSLHKTIILSLTTSYSLFENSEND